MLAARNITSSEWCNQSRSYHYTDIPCHLNRQRFDFTKQAGDHFLVITIWDGTDDGKKDQAIDEKLGEKRVDLRLQVCAGVVTCMVKACHDNPRRAGSEGRQGAAHHP